MATHAPHRLAGCDGYRVESQDGTVGWVEEVWLGRPGEPSAIAMRTVDGRHALLTERDVVAVLREDELVVTDPYAAMLELAPPRVEEWPDGDDRHLSASWSTTGAVLELPRAVRRTFPARPPWRVVRRAKGTERPLWQDLATLYTALAAIVLLVIGLAFIAAWLVAGTAY